MNGILAQELLLMTWSQIRSGIELAEIIVLSIPT